MIGFGKRRLTYANVLAVLALVFAMTGGAYAAKKYLITSTKQISPKVLKQLKGAKGPVGPSGAQGPAGPQGLAGAAGAKGENGAAGEKGPKGDPGEKGKDGVSVTGVPIPAGASEPCGEAGGTAYTSASGTENVCNGKEGPPGPQEIDRLPSKSTERGQWAVSQFITAESLGKPLLTAISFPIALSTEHGVGGVHFIPEGGKGAGPSEGCPETATVENPEAEPGNLCVFASHVIRLAEPKFFDEEENGSARAGRTGVVLAFTSTATGIAVAKGTWAVRAE